MLTASSMPALLARAIPFGIVAIFLVLIVWLVFTAAIQMHEKYGSFRSYVQSLTVTERVFYVFLLLILVILSLSLMF